MPMLHTINKSPFERRTLDTALRHAVKGSGILLIEDGIYAAIDGTVVADKVKSALESHKVYVLEPDIKARGMAEKKLIDGIQLVDYGGFVDLVTEYDKVQSWL
ncbi:MAG TPA: sulfurtransferase complex subunit TusB [Gammaproteobacteria bacterium]|nr:sulfurtransferase complex subunit TusB [Gammaproteobacteria bacterium]